MLSSLGHRAALSRLAAVLGCFTLIACGTGMECGGTITPPPGSGLTDAEKAEILRVKDDDHVTGDADAPITVIEYADLECPFCGRFARETLPTIKTEFVDTGMVRMVFRHFPLKRIHPCAETASRASECAHDQGMFDEFHTAVFNNQPDVCATALRQIASDLGLDTTDFNACLDSGEKAFRVSRDLDDATKLGITGTPTFFINGTSVSGFRSVEQFRADLNAAMGG